MEVDEIQIRELKLNNFRCFEGLTINFSTPYTVLIGINGSGKSSILDALRIALDRFISAIKTERIGEEMVLPRITIQVNDARIISELQGSILEQKAQGVVAIKISAEICKGNLVSWECNSENSSKINNFCSDIVVGQVLRQITEDKNDNLPIIAYYGTKRQWSKKNDDTVNKNSRFPELNGYVNCLSAKPFNIEVMRHWFARMLLIERKKPVPEFQAVKTAIANCYKNINDSKKLQDVAIDYDAEAEDIEIQQTFADGKLEILPLHYLSDGAKSILAIASDIAYRMAVLNPHLLGKVTEETDGVVLIDEIDMHLHPSWQRKVIDSLHKTFPKVQFIFTTHSPTVLTNVPKENIRILDDGKIYTPDVNMRGRDVNSILRHRPYA